MFLFRAWTLLLCLFKFERIKSIFENNREKEVCIMLGFRLYL